MLERWGRVEKGCRLAEPLWPCEEDDLPLSVMGQIFHSFMPVERRWADWMHKRERKQMTHPYEMLWCGGHSSGPSRTPFVLRVLNKGALP